MPPFLRNTLAVLAGLAVGSIVNIMLVNVGPSVVPLPEGADVSTIEGLAASMHLFKPANFLFPFLGHAVGTLVGAFIAAKFADSHEIQFALVVGLFSLAGGIAAVVMFGGPLWFKAADLLLAYIPMAFLGARLAGVPQRARADSSFA
ncbi:MAG: hypothetical protein ABI542_09745 [Gemmatimonadota bacterium]